jgi:hypothetical protein
MPISQKSRRSQPRLLLERRGSARTPVSLPALLHARDKASIWRVIELSHSGMLLERKRSSAAPKLPGLVRAVVNLPGGSVTVLGRPVWCSGRRIGLSTLAVTGDGEHRLVDYLFELMYSEQVPARPRAVAG